MTKKIIAIACSLVLSLSPHAQSIDESFIKSLPANIQQDFLKQSKSEINQNENVQSPDTRIKNIEAALDEAETTLESIKNELENQSDKSETNLERFGSNFFDSYQSSFLPINQPNLSPDYILDAGDVLNIQIIGQRNLVTNQKIKRDGTIKIPDIGSISIAGLSLRIASDLITETIAQSFTGAKSFVSISELRDINVLIVGNSNNPGMYTISGGSSPLMLIDVSGGISNKGSYRKISHKRNNQLLQNLDLYDVFIHGNLSFKHQLRSGDVLVIHPKLKEVRVSGSFANEAIFEIFDTENLSDLINMAGIIDGNSSNLLNIERLENDRLSELIVNVDEAASTDLRDGDSVKLHAVSPEFKKAVSVVVSGEVSIPGTYILDDNARLSDLLEKAGGYTDIAYPLAGIFYRQNVKELEELSKEKSYNELIRYLVSSPNFSQILTSPDSKGIITFLSILKDYEPTGRVVTEFDIQRLKSNPSIDPIILDGDQIHIPPFTQEVFVFGEVMNPGAVSYQELASVDSYIKRAGSFSRVSDAARVIVIAPNGETTIYSDSGMSLFSRKTYVLPGSTIYVPRRVGKLDGVDLAATVAPIISSMALSLASLNSIN